MKPDLFNTIPSNIPVIESIQEGPLDLWLSVCSPLFKVSPIIKEGVSKTYRTAAWHVDPITIANTQYQDMVNDHSRWHVEETGAQINVHRYSHGRASMETDGLPVECDTGVITLLDYSRPFKSILTACECHVTANQCYSFFVPHTAIDYRPSDANHSPVYEATSAMGRLIGQEMDNLINQLEGGATEANPSDIQRFLGCVEVGMSPRDASQSAREQTRNSLKLAIMKFIEARLSSTTLSVTLILQNFGVSRASLYRMFDAEGGVRNYIRRRRLYGAVCTIAENPLKRGQIHAASERWGFTSDTSFNRMVRREFGVAPGSLFEMPLRGSDNLSPLSDVHTLMTQAARRRKITV